MAPSIITIVKVHRHKAIKNLQPRNAMILALRKPPCLQFMYTFCSYISIVQKPLFIEKSEAKHLKYTNNSFGGCFPHFSLHLQVLLARVLFNFPCITQCFQFVSLNLSQGFTVHSQLLCYCISF